MINTNELTLDRLCSLIDHTLLKPYSSKEDFIKLCKEAKDNHFAMVAINSYPVRLCKELLSDSDVHVGAAIAFPLGAMSIDSKLSETLNAINDGADEIDYVINISKVKDNDYDYIRKEMETLVEAAHKYNRIIKVIFENCYLDKHEIIKLCEIAKQIKPDFIKTSTGFGTSGADIEDVRLMKSIVKDDVKVKAAGGIRDWKSCKAMIEAGAERIGTSSSLKIIEEFIKDKQ